MIGNCITSRSSERATIPANAGHFSMVALLAGVLLTIALGLQLQPALAWPAQYGRLVATTTPTTTTTLTNGNNNNNPPVGFQFYHNSNERAQPAADWAGIRSLWPALKSTFGSYSGLSGWPAASHSRQDVIQYGTTGGHSFGRPASGDGVGGVQPTAQVGHVQPPLGMWQSHDTAAAVAGVWEQPRFYKSLLSLQNPKLYGGDILLRMTSSRAPPQSSGGGGGGGGRRLLKFERSAFVNEVNRWPNGVIFYELDASVAHLARLIWSVMQQFHDETCIRFMPRLNREPNYLRIEAHRDCFSYIGRVGGEQTLSLGDGCDYRGTIAHELLHAVGFYHHQNRSDRDEFLEIIWENIARGKEGQFEKLPPSADNSQLNEFDYNSIMLYGPRTFGKTLDKVTMKPKREGVILLEVIEKQGLSQLDVDSVNKLYKCDPYNAANVS